METKDRIVVATDFNKSLGARYKYEGPYSGELFLETILKPKFLEAQKDKYILEIVLDGVMGYPSSFISGSFGKLSLEYGAENILTYIKFLSSNHLRIEKIIKEIKSPKKK